jgi:hypothetical protein
MKVKIWSYHRNKYLLDIHRRKLSNRHKIERKVHHDFEMLSDYSVLIWNLCYCKQELHTNWMLKSTLPTLHCAYLQQHH